MTFSHAFPFFQFWYNWYYHQPCKIRIERETKGEVVEKEEGKKRCKRRLAHKLNVRIRKCTLQNPFEHLSVAGTNQGVKANITLEFQSNQNIYSQKAYQINIYQFLFVHDCKFSIELRMIRIEPISQNSESIVKYFLHTRIFLIKRPFNTSTYLISVYTFVFYS